MFAVAGNWILCRAHSPAAARSWAFPHMENSEGPVNQIILSFDFMEKAILKREKLVTNE